MEYIRLKNSDLSVSRLCFGGCPMGGHGWGDTSREDIIQAVNTAIENGINFFDTADTYGLGESEKILGMSAKRHRKDIVIATKFGVRRDSRGRTFYDNSSEWINQAVVNSLRRLDTDYIDLYQVHYRDRKTPLIEVIETLEELKQKGVIRHYGLSNIYKEDIEEVSNVKSYLISFQDEYSLANRTHEHDINTLTQKLNLSPMTWGSLGQGILTGKYNEDVKFTSEDRRSREIYRNFHGEKLVHNLKIVSILKKISLKLNKPVPALAIRWILDYLPGSVVIAGVKNSSQLELNTQGLNWSLETEYLEELEKISRDGGVVLEQS